LLATAARYYSNPDHSGKDESLWQVGELDVETGVRAEGIAQIMLEALRAVGILDELKPLANGRVLRYPGASTLVYPQKTIKIVGVWFNYWRFLCQQKGETVPERMQDVSKADMDAVKVQVHELAQTRFRDLHLTIRREGGRALAYTEQGNLFGYIAKEHTDDVEESLTIRFAFHRDGNYWVVFE